jgi:predicted cobalt transporter CbtA
MVRNLLIRGMIVGLVAGLFAVGFAKIFGEPQVDRAIAFESELAAQKGEAEAPELVSREVQSGLGLLTGVLVYSTGLGGLFALVFASMHGRVGRLSARATSALLAAGGFVSVILVPFLKYPANPPSVGDPETIGMRTSLYFVMIAVSIAALALAVSLARRLAARHGGWNATLLALAAYVVIIVATQLLLPAVNEVPDAFPAVVLWKFRVASLGIQMVLWTTLGLLFGALADREFAKGYGGMRAALR